MSWTAWWNSVSPALRRKTSARIGSSFSIDLGQRYDLVEMWQRSRMLALVSLVLSEPGKAMVFISQMGFTPHLRRAGEDAPERMAHPATRVSSRGGPLHLQKAAPELRLHGSACTKPKSCSPDHMLQSAKRLADTTLVSHRLLGRRTSQSRYSGWPYSNMQAR